MRKAISCVLLALLPACAGELDSDSTDVSTNDSTDVSTEVDALVKKAAPITESPNPLVFPTAIYGDGACGSSGSSSCTYAEATLKNNTSSSLKISGASATGVFWVTWGGTCNDSAHRKTIAAGRSCTLQFGFNPTGANGKFSGTGTVTFTSGDSVSFSLRGNSGRGLTATPDPMTFANATFGGTCPGTGCTYAEMTITNNYGTPRTIDSASASNAQDAFWVTWGGTCNNSANAKVVAARSSCTLQFGFFPNASGTAYVGRSSVSFTNGEAVTSVLKGTSN